MLNKIFKKYIFPIATMSGSIIGVGFLSLPYITSKVGAWPMFLYFIGLTALVVCIHIIFGEISLKTPDHKRWPGFVGFYLGKLPKKIILVSMTAGTFGVMLVYLIIGSQFMTAILQPLLGGSNLVYLLCYFAAGALCIYFGVKIISRVDFLVMLFLLAVLGLIFWNGFSHIKWENIFVSNIDSLGGNIAYFFLPYGALLFSLWGTSFIPEIEEMVSGNKKSLKKILIFSTIIPAIFYGIFTFLVLSISGNATTESALLGLTSFLGQKTMSVVLLMGVVTTFIGFIAQGLLLKKIFMYDLGFQEFPSWVFTVVTPLALFLIGFNSFIPLISFIGGVLLSIDGLLILLVYKKVGGRKMVIYPLATIFILQLLTFIYINALINL